MINIFLDDSRTPPNEEYVQTFRVEDTIELLTHCEVDELWLDNDLGDFLLEGRKVMDWIDEQVHTNPDFKLPKKIVVHSGNRVAKEYMERIIKKLYNQ